jgi:hypothetical protein
LHGSFVTGDIVEGSDLDLLAIVEEAADIDAVTAELLEAILPMMSPATPLDLDVMTLAELNPLHRRAVAIGEVILGDPLEVSFTAQEWAMAALKAAAVTVLTNPVAAALWATSGRVVRAGAPIPRSKAEAVTSYRDVIGDRWSDTLDRLHCERHAVTADLTAQALEFLDEADNDEHRERVVEQIRTIPERTVRENSAVDPASRPWIYLPAGHDLALTVDECDRAIGGRQWAAGPTLRHHDNTTMVDGGPTGWRCPRRDGRIGLGSPIGDHRVLRTADRRLVRWWLQAETLGGRSDSPSCRHRDRGP